MLILCIVGFLLFTGVVSAEKYYKVQPGDTLFRIAQNYQVDMNAVIASNPSITNAGNIQAGQTIMIPDIDGVPFTVTAYTAGYESTNKRPCDPGYGLTSLGVIVQDRKIIAIPPSLPFVKHMHSPDLH